MFKTVVQLGNKMIPMEEYEIMTLEERTDRVSGKIPDALTATAWCDECASGDGHRPGCSKNPAIGWVDVTPTMLAELESLAAQHPDSAALKTVIAMAKSKP